jgi:hypothetical protein
MTAPTSEGVRGMGTKIGAEFPETENRPPFSGFNVAIFDIYQANCFPRSFPPCSPAFVVADDLSASLLFDLTGLVELHIHPTQTMR